MAGTAPEELSPLLDEEPWRAWGALGPAWMVKWTTRCGGGYVLIVTDGVRGFCESRDAEYVAEKAKEWAGCIEADGARSADAAESRIAELVLGTLLHAVADDGDDEEKSDGGIATARRGSAGRGGDRVEVAWEEENLTLHLRAALHQDLPYSWTFCLSPLAPQQVLQLVVVPLAVQLQCLTQQLQQKDLQLQQLMRKLADVTPDGGARLKLPQIDVQEALDAAAVKVLSEGSGAALPPHLTGPLHVCVRKRRTHSAAGETSLASAGPPRAVRPRRPILGLGRPRPIAEEDAAPLPTEAEQLTRRGRIQALSQGPAPTTGHASSPSKETKKKKLKI